MIEKVEQSHFLIPIFYTRKTTKLLGKSREWVAAADARAQAEARAVKQAMAILAKERETRRHVVSTKQFFKSMFAPLAKHGRLLAKAFQQKLHGGLASAARP